MAELDQEEVVILPVRATSLTGDTIELFFSQVMNPANPALLDPDSYTLTVVFGGAPATIVSIVAGEEEGEGLRSVVLTHTGTTIGGLYEISSELLDESPTFLTRGTPPTATCIVEDGGTICFSFDKEMLAQPDSATDDVSSYQFTSEPAYPIALTPTLVTFPADSDPTKVRMTVRGMTSLDYTARIGPADAILINGALPPGTAINPTGGTTAVVGATLSTTKKAGQVYGWTVPDVSGRLAAGTTFRLDFTLDASAATFAPSLDIYTLPEPLTVTLSDGDVEIAITFQVGSVLGQDEIVLTSGDYTESVVIPWQDQAHQVSLLRNAKADTYCLLLDEAPILAASIATLNGVSSFGPGVQWQFDGPWTTTNFSFGPLRLTASSTLFGIDWNFLHEAAAEFEGDPSLARDWLTTKRGPLVRGWGDATPATRHDVEVRVNGTAVEVKGVNPYIGKVFLRVPIPLLPPGDPQGGVAVDYKWFATPIMSMTGLNTEGLTLNKYDRATGHHAPPAHGEQPKKHGAMGSHRFPMGVVLGPIPRPKPKLISHRYMGFERAYSALLNSPTTLCLNQPPGRVAVQGFTHKTTSESVSYEATTLPGDAEHPWEVVGAPVQNLDYTANLLLLSDDRSGSFNPGSPQVAYFRRPVALNDPAAMRVVARLYTEPGSIIGDGVFTGVSLGFHDNDRLYLVGLLTINGVSHVGVLLDPDTPHLTASWKIGPTVVATAVAKNKLVFMSGTVPEGARSGTRLQVLTGLQTGVYTAESVVWQTTGEVTITLTDNLQGLINAHGGKYPEVTFELDHTTPYTLRLEADSDQQTLAVSFAGALRGDLVTVDGLRTTLPSPSQSSLMFDTSGKGEVFFGSTSRKATSTSAWSFARYAVMPDQTSVLGHAVVVNAEMSDLPETNPDGLDWFTEGSFGRSLIEADADRLVLRSEVASATVNYSWAYKRIEPFLIPEATCDLRTKFQVDTGTLGAGDAQLVVLDGQKEVRVVSLLYGENLFPKYRELVSLSSVSAAGILDPVLQGWTLGGTAGVVSASTLITTGSSNYKAVLDSSAMLVGDTGGRVVEAAFKVVSHTPGGGSTGIRVFGDALSISVGFELRTNTVALIDSVGAIIREYAFAWDDQKEHLYRVVVDADASTVVLTVDDTVMLPVEALGSFTGGDNLCRFGMFPAGGSTAVVEWRSVAVSVHAPASLKRTIGVYKGGDSSDINSYELPRLDASEAPNSSATGPDIQEMDWREDLDLRVLRDPSWGVTVYRPDLALPPYYNPEQEGVVGSGFITETVEPSAGWINVEWARLPYKASTFGSVTFGAPDATSITQQRWDYLRYRIWRHPVEDRRAPRHMVLNKHNIITSGERTRDTSLEKVVVQVLDRTRVTLRPAHIYADEVLKIEDGNQLFTWHDWTFDPVSQTVSLGLDGTGAQREFSTSTAKVTVTFTPSDTVTSTWLEQQPLLNSITLLNEGTPPYPKNQTGKATKEVIFGSGLNDPDDVLNNDPGFNLNDPKRTLVFKDDQSAIYEDLTFFTLDDQGENPIASICEGTLSTGPSGWSEAEKKATGGHVLALSGSSFWQGHFAPPTPAFDQLGGTPGALFMASGGSFVGPVVDAQGNKTGAVVPLGGLLNKTITFPSAPVTGPAWTGRGRVRQRTDWHIHLWAVTVEVGEAEFPLEETLPVADDTTAPTGVVHELGAVQWVTIGAGDFSHIGPWGGLPSLIPAAGQDMTQSSLLAGGSFTTPSGLHDPLLGMVCQGGNVLPVGATTVTTVTPS